MSTSTPRVLVALPLVAALAGAGIGWFTRDSADQLAGSGSGLITASEDGTPPEWHLDSAAIPTLIDRDRIVGYPSDPGTEVPKGAVVPLATENGVITPVDAGSLAPATGGTVALPPAAPTPLAQPEPPEAPPSTAPLADPADATTVPSLGTFTDPCTTADTACAGAPARVATEPVGEARRLDPLRISVPFAATGAYASMCGAIEGSAAPDPFLAPAVRPTVAVVVNQPASIALSGNWSDNNEIEKATMVSSPDQEAEWRRAWEQDGEQRLLLACLTLPLDDVREHAQGGRADVKVSLLGISATGRADMAGRLTLTIPLDQDEAPFADQVTIASLGEQRSATGSLVPTVHVHYALETAGLVPKVSTLDQRTAKVYVQHEFVEAADCTGWSNNAQGVSRTAGSTIVLAQEQRTLGGRATPVTVVDADLALDPALPGGWQGFVCVKVFAADRGGNRVTIALRGAQVQSPLTPVYEVGAVIDDTTFPVGWKVELSWADPQRVLWCGPVQLDASNPGATCTAYARSFPDGIVLIIRAVDDEGEARPAFVIRVPVDAGYCTPDDPFAAAGDGCGTGFTETVRVPADPNARDAVAMDIVVHRTAQRGTAQVNPAHAWAITATQAFQF